MNAVEQKYKLFTKRVYNLCHSDVLIKGISLSTVSRMCFSETEYYPMI